MYSRLQVISPIEINNACKCESSGLLLTSKHAKTLIMDKQCSQFHSQIPNM